jgi:serine/threonine protein kinase
MHNFVTEWSPIKLDALTPALLQRGKIIHESEQRALRIVKIGSYVIFCKQYHKHALELQYVLAEIKANAQLYSPYIVAMYGVVEDETSIYLLFECGNKNLADYMVLRRLLPEKFVAHDIVRPLLGAVHYANSKGIIHRAISPKRVVHFENNTWKLAGWKYSVNTMYHNALAYSLKLCKRLPYVPPEIYLYQGGDANKIDVYSIGCLAADALIHLEYSLECRDFISRSTQKNACERETAVNLRRHKWLVRTPQTRLRRSHSLNDVYFAEAFVEERCKPRCLWW